MALLMASTFYQNMEEHAVIGSMFVFQIHSKFIENLVVHGQLDHVDYNKEVEGLILYNR